MAIWIQTDLCNGCKRCIKACAYGAVEIKEGKAAILDRCTGCGACLSVCREAAIQTDAQPKMVPDFSDRKGVWVFAEQRTGRLAHVSLELLGKAQDLAAQLDEEVSAVIVGDGVTALAEPLFRFGAQTVYVADHPSLAHYRSIPYTDVIEELVKSYRPSVLLMGATHLGRDLAPRVSRRIGVGLTADCTELTIDSQEKFLLQTRPAFGGNVMATIANRYSRPQMATVRPGVMEPRERPENQGQVIPQVVSVREETMGMRVIEVVREQRRHVNLSQARVIVAGGRGVGDAKGFETIGALAALLGGELAGTRVAVEEGWIPAERQVGQTGQSVRPELYIACGISGAIQHRAGMMGSRYIVAINRDPRAPIFQVADWGIPGDLHEIIPEMMRQLKIKK
jgi:electron transfer flavoprotein alpha subunit/NAD-dependent dihydropyrimidine dehydrogenase PreA subunit